MKKRRLENGWDGTVTAAGNFDTEIPDSVVPVNGFTIQVTEMSADTMDVYSTCTEIPGTGDWVLLKSYVGTTAAPYFTLSINSDVSQIRLTKTGATHAPKSVIMGRW